MINFRDPQIPPFFWGGDFIQTHPAAPRDIDFRDVLHHQPRHGHKVPQGDLLKIGAAAPWLDWCRFTQGMDGNGGCWDYENSYDGSFPHSLRLAPVSCRTWMDCTEVKFQFLQCWKGFIIMLLNHDPISTPGVRLAAWTFVPDPRFLSVQASNKVSIARVKVP